MAFIVSPNESKKRISLIKKRLMRKKYLSSFIGAGFFLPGDGEK
jgi:hypothetical protein